ncbi:GvpL/GvpF family gas vesicle protein [Phormidium sp. LEGE 05292]|uniref:gas vesicle protein GvpF n=1 Tax=[Phormidium] sp. LEGE 05292 TaxID=767427 RepID=UPI0018813BC0|nr:GvpL/GvpF family gas vesicle protein [Phormidium sp. LEGE 05292]MBE9228876.1 GvpL/GvpF family gas vesicle protein [Phormidium sp. LEGE 05292]
MDCGLYLYGIFPEAIPEQVAIEGMDKQPVYSALIEGFSFLYSVAKQEKYFASRRNLICHEKVLEEVMNEGFRTLLPLRFGMVVKTWETVTEQLTKPYQDKLKDLFAKLAERREVSVKIFWDNKSELQALLSVNQDLKQKRDAMEGKTLSMEEVIDIGQMIEKGLELRKQDVIQAFRNELNPGALEVVENDPMTEGMIYNAAYLIPWDAEAEFSDRVEAIDQKFGDRLRIRYNNLTAPYTFAQLV